MSKTRIIALFWVLWMVLPLVGQEAVATQLKYYAERYSGTPDAQKRIRLANDFFSYLQKIEYLDESVVFPNDAHIDSVDVNVYYYIAEWYYGDGQYSQATAYCSRAAEALCAAAQFINGKALNSRRLIAGYGGPNGH